MQRRGAGAGASRCGSGAWPPRMLPRGGSGARRRRRGRRRACEQAVGQRRVGGGAAAVLQAVCMSVGGVVHAPGCMPRLERAAQPQARRHGEQPSSLDTVYAFRSFYEQCNIENRLNLVNMSWKPQRPSLLSWAACNAPLFILSLDGRSGQSLAAVGPGWAPVGRRRRGGQKLSADGCSSHRDGCSSHRDGCSIDGDCHGFHKDSGGFH